ncbi:hypothetical protein [Pseudomonas saudimassiliensis]|uniref:hypothetical protein n=1 Tax=Pseudomonas saudimassiliensis TaxID=1461581 RepID=UPI0013018C69|nr:hypothetical protein [Pseudomonas saudimassiliensis]
MNINQRTQYFICDIDDRSTGLRFLLGLLEIDQAVDQVDGAVALHPGGGGRLAGSGLQWD